MSSKLSSRKCLGTYCVSPFICLQLYFKIKRCVYLDGHVGCDLVQISVRESVHVSTILYETTFSLETKGDDCRGLGSGSVTVTYPWSRTRR